MLLRHSDYRSACRMNSDCRRRPRKPRLSPYWHTRHGTGGRRTSPRQPAQRAIPYSGRFRMRNNPWHAIAGILVTLLLFTSLSCSSKTDLDTLVMIIESSPANLDPRVGLDAQSERIDDLLFDDLLSRDDHLNVQPGLAERWEIPDPRTYVFHLHRGVKFHGGRPLTARDVKWTFDSLLQGKIRSTKAAAYRLVDRIDAPDDYTLVFHLKEPFATLLWNVSDGAIGIVPYGSGEEMSRNPIGSGPFRFVSAEPDKDVVLARNDEYW